MTWKKHFQSPSAIKKFQALQHQAENDPTTSSHLNSYSSRFASWLPDVYVGQPNRIERYSQYDNMDLDTEVSCSLDTIADSCTSQDEDSKLPFEIEYIGNVSEEEIVILQDMLRQWYEINGFEMKLWRLFRSVLKYGDQILIRDPQTYKLFWCDHTKVESVVVDEAKGKKPETYVIRDLDLNLQTLVATGSMKSPSDQRGYSSGPLSSGHAGGTLLGQHGQNKLTSGGSTNYTGNSAIGFEVSANHVVHLSLSEGMDNVWPFGVSILENVFKAYKKKELIEDAVVIYRVQRAPERRVFYVDTGRLPTHKAHAYLERVKNEIQQKRIPSRNGGESNVLDATYNPMSMLEDYYFAQNADGKGSRVETLPGGDQLGEIDDLKYFNHQMRIGLRIPRSYMPDFNDGGGALFNDGRIGTAYIEEYRYSRYCERLQNLIMPPLDNEFKLFCKHRGVNIHSSLFNLRLVKPQNFSKYREIELDGAVLSVYSQVADIPHISRRFGLQKYANWTKDEILQNERMWQEENKNKSSKNKNSDMSMSGGSSFGDVGAGPQMDIGDEAGLNDDDISDVETGTESPISGEENLNNSEADNTEDEFNI